MINLKNIINNSPSLIHESACAKDLVQVYENNDYRWLTLGSNSIQSIMLKSSPHQLLLPVPQAMLISLLWQKPNRILNLGLGGGAIERFLTHINIKNIDTVEINQAVVHCTNEYFGLPPNVHVYQQSAISYLATASKKYDLVICDLFDDKNNPSFVHSEEFYTQLSHLSSSYANIAVNVFVETEKALLNLLFAIGQSFAHKALISFIDYKNIVLLLSHETIPSSFRLNKILSESGSETLFDFTSVVQSLRHI